MPDLALQLSETGVDLLFEDGDLAISETLLEPVLVSLFSDARAPDGTDLPDRSGDPRGWWAEGSGEFGSLLWLLERAKLSEATAVEARTYAVAALEWMVEEDIAASVDVVAAIERPAAGEDYLSLTVALERGTSSQWESAWEATKETDWSAERWRLNLLLR